MTMAMTLLLGLAAAMAAIAVLVVVTADGMLARRAINKSLRQATWDDPAMAQVRERELAAPVSQRLVVPGLKRIGKLARRFAPASVIERLDEELTYAGSPIGWDGERVLAIKVAAIAGVAVLGFVAGTAVGLGFVRTVLLAAVGGLVGWYLPEWILRSRSGQRQHSIRRSLPDALDLLSITVEAGLGFDAALDRVAREIRGPLGGELYRVVQEMRLGKARSDALRDLGERSNVQELRSFVLSMVQAEIFGISIASVLHVQANELRIKRRQLAEEQAQKLPVKIIFPLILCIFPALFAVLLGPAAIRIYESLLQGGL
jgi:tight adherence protein C